MARIIFSALVSTINGSIAGTTFQRNAYGHTVKKKPTIVNPNRRAQQPRKASMQFISQQWQNLSAAQRTAWANQAVTYPVPSRLNPAANLTGHALWLRLNLLRLLMGATVINNITAAAQDTLVPGTSEIQRVGGTLIFFDDSDSTLDHFDVLCFVSNQVKPTQLYDRSRTRYMGTFPLLVADQIDITAAYLAQFGTLPTTGDSIFLKRLYLNGYNGQLVEFRQQNVQVV